MKVNSTRIMAVPASKLWQGVTSEGHLALAHPYVDQHLHGGPMGLGEKDRIVYLNGLTFERQFTAWEEGLGYDLRIGRPNGKSRSLVEWRINSIDSHQSSLSITVHPDLLRRWPSWLRWIAFRIRVKPQLQSYLDAVTGGIAYWLETGAPVRRSDHPNHPWFGDVKNQGQTGTASGFVEQ